MTGKKLDEQVSPNFKLIKQYFKGTGNEGGINRGYFKEHYNYYAAKPEFESFTQLLGESGFLDDHNLYFFGAWYFDSAESTNYLESTGAFKIWNKRNKELVKLKETFSEVKQSYRLVSPERIFLKSISFELISSKGIPKKAKLTAHPLMYNLFRHLEKFVRNEKVISQPKEKNVKTYTTDFILSTKPFYSYLKDTHFKNQSKNAVYKFIADFLNTFEKSGKNTLLWEQIKDIYQKRGKSNVKNK